MRFELLKLYRNYRNIESMQIEEDHSMVLGHFDSVHFTKSSTADDALNDLYENIINQNQINGMDVQPMILFSFDDDTFYEKENKFRAVSFLQINKPDSCVEIEDYFHYAKKSIKEVVEELRKQNIIDTVTFDVYIPFSFMNVAVIFNAENLTDICTVVKNITNSKLADFQYSILTLPENYEAMSYPSKKIGLSLRFIWKEGIDTCIAINKLKQSIKHLNGATVDFLLGNNDCLLHVPESGYEVISMILNPQNDFNEFMINVENTRATISFPEKSVAIHNFSFSKNTCFKNKNITQNTMYLKEQALIDSLMIRQKSAPDLLKRDINDILYRVVEFSKFINVIKKHAAKGIASSLYFSMREPYELFLEICKEKIDDAEPDTLNNRLETIGNIINEMSAYYGNLFHCNLGFFEERGFYNNIIGLASNVELAYNKYANCICQAILSDEERYKDSLKICCSVTSDKEPFICTVDLFEDIVNPAEEDKCLVNVNIPVSYIFKYDFVSRIIIHEIAHHIGGRDREGRLKAICNCFASIVTDSIIQSIIFSSDNAKSNCDKVILNKFEKTKTYKRIHRKMSDSIFKVLNNRIYNYVNSVCEKHYFMDNVIESIYYALNNLPYDMDAIDEISELISEFRILYYQSFEDFYQMIKADEKKDFTLLPELSNFSIKLLDKEITKLNVKKVFDLLVKQNSSADEQTDLLVSNCFMFIPDMDEFINYFCNAVSEAYCDIMMITLSKMNFSEYLDLLSEYGKTIENIIEGNDYLTWIRINIIARYLGEEDSLNKEVPHSLIYFNDLKLYDYIKPYFESLRDEFDAAFKRSQSDNLLTQFLNGIFSTKEEEQISAVFKMFYGIA